MNSSAYPDDMPLESRLVSSSIASAQSQVEARNFEIRKNVLKYDDVLSRQREVVYATRRRILEGEDIEDMVQRFMDFEVGPDGDRLHARRQLLGVGPARAVRGVAQPLPGDHHPGGHHRGGLAASTA
jgi:hypothetical protein